jgi:hypothetical protein
MIFANAHTPTFAMPQSPRFPLSCQKSPMKRFQGPADVPICLQGGIHAVCPCGFGQDRVLLGLQMLRFALHDNGASLCMTTGASLCMTTRGSMLRCVRAGLVRIGCYWVCRCFASLCMTRGASFSILNSPF